MSLYGSMFSGVSGLNAQSQALGMISDNISNVNTVGYKTSKASFSTLITRQSTNFYAPGGVRSAPVSEIDRQGLLQASANPTDVALSGDGFFIVTDTDTPLPSDTRFFSRAGQFLPDAQGFLVSPAGFYLQGWRTDSAGVPVAPNPSVMTSLQPVRVSASSGSAVPTSTVDIAANLPASAPVATTHITNVQIFDSLGVAQDLTLTWVKTAANTWDLSVTTPNAGAVEKTAVGSGITYGAGTPMTVVFNGDGTPLSFDGVVGGTPPVIALSGWTDGALDSLISLNLGTSGLVGTALPDNMTQFSSQYSVAFINQDGVQFGNFIGVTIDEQGIVTALYDNGETLNIFRLPIATFPNPNGLAARTGTVFTQSRESGDFILRQAGEANAGTIVPSALESSTTDLANEFTNMIITQRAYSASTRVITTADEMLDELIRIKR